MTAIKLGSAGEIPWLSVIRMAWKQKFLILAIWALVAVAIVVVVYRLPAIYEAETLILVDGQQIPEKYVSSTVNMNVQERLTSISQQILSSTRLQRIIDNFDLYRQERQNRFPEEIIERMRKDIKVTLEKGWSPARPGAFRVAYQGRNPAVVADVTNQLGNLFIEENLRVRESQAASTSEFIENQLNEARKQLEVQEARVSQYKIQHNGQLPQQENSLIGTLARLHVQLQGHQDAINRAQQNKVMLENAIAIAETSESAFDRLTEQTAELRPQTGAKKSGVASPRPAKKSESLRAELDTLRLRYSDDHPEVKRLLAAIPQAQRAEEREAQERARLASELQKEEAATAEPKTPQPALPAKAEAKVRENARIAELRSQLKLTTEELEKRNTERERLLRDIGSYQARVEQLPIREQEMAGLTRDYEISKGNYRSLLDKKFAAEMSTEMERRQKAERFTVVDRAAVPQKPVSPNRPLFNGIGCVVGLLLGLGTGLGKEWRKDQLLGEWELPGNSYILARVPRIRAVEFDADPLNPSRERDSKISLRKSRRALVATAVLSLLAVIVAGAYWAWKRF